MDQSKQRKSRKKIYEDGRIAEFSRMSLNPGIGAQAMEVVGKSLKLHPNVLSSLDVPAVLKHSGKLWPLGRYLRRKIRESLGRSPDSDGKELWDYGLRMRVLHEDRTERIGYNSASNFVA